MKKLTILITNYNYGKYLSRCIRSCISQTMSKEEYDILIVDDKSSDCSSRILDHWNGKHNIRVIKNSHNLGLGNSCNVGIMNCETPYIVRVDADDYVSEDFCKFLYVYASSNNCHAVACDYIEVDLDENIIGRFDAKSKPIACGILFRTDCIEQIGYYSDKRINEDVDLRLRFDREFKVSHLDVPMYRYLKHPSSMTARDKKYEK